MSDPVWSCCRHFIFNVAVVLIVRGVAILTLLVPAAGWPSNDAVPHIRHTLVLYFLDQSALEARENKYRYDPPPSFVLVDSPPDYPSEPTVSIRLTEDYRATYPVPSADTFEWFAHGIDDGIAGALLQSPAVLVADFSYALQDAARSLLLADRWAHQIAMIHNAVVFDVETHQLFARKEWETIRLGGWVEKTPVMSDHVMVHVYRHEGATRAVTRGMKKFGLPDMVVDDFNETLSSAVVRLLYLSAQTLVERGGAVQENWLELDIGQLTETPLKSSLLAAKADDAPGKYRLSVGAYEGLDDDPDNALIALLLDEGVGQTPVARQHDILNSLFGLENGH